MVRELLLDKTAIERANIKATEIAKIGSIPRTNVKFSGADYDIEVLEIKAIEGGVELLAKAWTPDGKQVGFGKDGTVEIERFRIFNPPIRATGTVRVVNIDGKDNNIADVVEDLPKALLQTLAHTIKTVKAQHPDNNVISGKIGNTTSTFFPDADAESTSFDGRATIGTAGVSFASVRGGNGTAVNDTLATLAGALLNASTVSNEYFDMGRGFYLFDTSAIPDTDTIDSATLSVIATAKEETIISQSIGWTVATTASNTGATATDYENSLAAVTRLATDITIASIDVGGSTYTDWALNASGLTNISKTGVSKFCEKLSADIDNSAPTWASGGAASITIRNAETADTTSDPKLVVVHSVAAAAANHWLLMGV